MSLALLEEANQFFEQGRFEEAAFSFAILVSEGTEYSESPLVLQNLGRCYSEMGQYGQAIEIFEKCGMLLMRLSAQQRSSPEEDTMVQETFFQLGMAQYHAQKFSFAKQSFERAQAYGGKERDEITVMIFECEEKASFMASAGLADENLSVILANLDNALD